MKKILTLILFISALGVFAQKVYDFKILAPEFVCRLTQTTRETNTKTLTITGLTGNTNPKYALNYCCNTKNLTPQELIGRWENSDITRTGSGKDQVTEYKDLDNKVTINYSFFPIGTISETLGWKYVYVVISSKNEPSQIDDYISDIICIEIRDNILTTTISQNTQECKLNSLIGTCTGENIVNEYNWKLKNNNIFSTIESTTINNFQPTKSGIYKLEVIDECGYIKESSEITITEKTPLNPGFIYLTDGPGSVMKDYDPTGIINPTGAPSNGVGTVNLQWEKSNDQTNWITITGAKNLTYDPVPISTTTYYRRKATDNCTSKYTNYYKIAVIGEPQPGEIFAESNTLCYGTMANIIGNPSTGLIGSNFNYSWEMSNDLNSWTEILGTNSISLQTGYLYETTYFRRKSWIESNKILYTNIITITVLPKINKPVIGENQIVEIFNRPKDLAIITCDKLIEETVNYKWLKINISGEENIVSNETYINNYKFPDNYSLTEKEKYKLEIQIVSPIQCPSISSDPVTIELEFTPGIISSDQILCSNIVPKIIIGTSPRGNSYETYTYQWQKSEDLETWVNLPTATGISYQPEQLSKTTFYRRKDHSSLNKDKYTNIITIEVKQKMIAPIIGESDIICIDNRPSNIIVKKDITGGGNFRKYRWVRIENGVRNNYSWTNTFNNFEFSETYKAKNDLSFELEVETGNTLFETCESTKSNRITIDVKGNKTSGALDPLAYTIFSNTSPGAFSIIVMPTTDATNMNWIWQKSTDNKVFADIVGTKNTLSYQPVQLTQTTYYRIRIYDECGEIFSSQSVVNVFNNIIPGYIVNDDKWVCKGENITINLTATQSTGEPPLIHVWQYSTDSVNWVNWLTCNTGNNEQYMYNLSKNITINDTTYFRKKIYNFIKPENPVYTNVVTYYLYENAPHDFIIAGPPSNCEGDIPDYLEVINMPARANITNITWEQFNGLSWDEIYFSYNNVTQNKLITPDVWTDGQPVRATARNLCTGAKIYSNELIITNIPRLKILTGANGAFMDNNYSACIGKDYFVKTKAIADIPKTDYTVNWYDGITETLISTADSFCYNTENQLYLYCEYVSKACPLHKEYANFYFINRNKKVSNPTIDFYSLSSKNTINICSGVINKTEFPFVISKDIIETGLGATNAPFKYQWQDSVTGGKWKDIASATSKTFNPSTYTTTTYIRLKVTTTSNCYTLYSNILEVKVQSMPDPSTITSAAQTICYSIIPDMLTATPATGGNGLYTYQWKKMVFGKDADYVALINANAVNYQPNAMKEDTYFRRYVKSGVCPEVYTTEKKITVIPEIVPGKIEESQAISYNTQPALLTGTDASSALGTGSYTFQWQVSDDAKTYYNLAGINTLNYQPPVLKTTKYYRRLDKSGNCIEKPTNVLEIVVFENLYGGAIDVSDQTKKSICYGTSPGLISTKTPPTGGSGTFEYQWQKKTETTNWTNINGAYNANITISNLFETTTYRKRTVTSISNDTAYSNSTTIYVFEPLSSGLIEDNQIICYETAPSSIDATPTTGGSNQYIYQWQVSDNNNTWNLVASNTEDCNQSSIGTLYGSKYYRRKTTDISCGEVYTNSVFIQVTPELKAGSITSSTTVSICENTIASLITATAASGGDGNYTYFWEISRDNNNWSTIPESNTVNYQPPTLSDTMYFRRSVLSVNCPIPSTQKISINTLKTTDAGLIKGEQTICFDTYFPERIQDSVSPSGGTNTYTYKWQKSEDLENWSNMTGATYQYLVQQNLKKTTFYRRVVNSSNCPTSYSNAIKIKVLDSLDAGTIKGEQAICYGSKPLDIRVTNTPSGGSGNYTETWQSGTSMFMYDDLLDATSNAYYLSSPLTTDTYFRKRVDDQLCGTAYTDTILVSVSNPYSAGYLTANQTIVETKLASLLKGTLPTGGIADNKYRWQFSTDNLLWVTVPASNSLNYQPELLRDTTYFRRIDVNTCGTDTTNSVKINVLKKLEPGTIDTNQIICYATLPSLIKATKPTGGNGIYNYQWQSSSDGLSWTNILVSALSINYQPTTLKQSMFYRRRVTCSTYDTAYTVPVYIAVTEEIKIPTMSGDQILCPKSPVEAITILENQPEGVNSYKWFESTNKVEWTEIIGQDKPYLIPSQTTGKKYYKIAISNVCKNYETGIVTVEFLPKIIAGDVYESQTVGYGQKPAEFTGTPAVSSSDNIKYTWIMSYDNTSFSAVVGGDSTYLILPKKYNTTYYKRIDRDMCNADTTETLKITVLPNLLEGSISENQKVCSGKNADTIKVTSPTGGSGTYSYQWQKSSDGVNWINILINGTKSYFLPTSIETSTFFRRRVNCSTYDTAYSYHSYVDIYKTIGQPYIGQAQQICYMSTPEPLRFEYLPSGDGNNNPDNYKFNWYQSTNDVTWMSLNDNNDYLLTGKQNTDKYYRVKVEHLCGFIYSNSIKVGVYQQFDGGIAEPDQVVESGFAPSIINGEIPTGGDGTYTYQWQKSTGNNWSDVIVEGSSINYQPEALTDTTFFRRLTFNTCGTDTTNFVRIEVMKSITPGQIQAENSTICFNYDASINGEIPTGGSGNYTYQWEESTDGKNWTIMTGKTSKNVIVTGLKDTTYYRRLDKSSTCVPYYTNTAIVNVRGIVDAPLVSYQKILCKGGAVKVTVINPLENMTYKWYDKNGQIEEGKLLDIAELGSSTTLQVRAINEINCASDYTKFAILVDSIKADFYVQEEKVDISSAIQFHNNSINAVSYEWNFYDGDGSTEENPYHYYNEYTFDTKASLVVKSPHGCIDSITKLNLFDVGVGFKSIEKESIEIYPTIVESLLFVNGANEVTITDQAGRIITVTKGENQIILDLSNLVSGIYLVKAESEKENKTIKILKK